MNMYDNGTVTQQAGMAETNASKAAEYDRMKDSARLNDAANMGADRAYAESALVIDELMNRFNQVVQPQVQQNPGLAGIRVG